MIYYHNVLEAKLVLGDFVFSIATEFIENEDENVSKQDCERKAFYRLSKKLKNDFKRLPICISGDSLYACEPVMTMYKGHSLNIVKSVEDKENKRTKFVYISSIKIKKKNVVEIERFARKRWKIENEGFNVQKNQGYELEHLYSMDSNAMKNHYLLLQIAHMI